MTLVSQMGYYCTFIYCFSYSNCHFRSYKMSPYLLLPYIPIVNCLTKYLTITPLLYIHSWTDSAVTLHNPQVAVLLPCASLLRQSATLRDYSDLWPHSAEVSLPDHAQTASGQVPGREGQNATRETHSSPHPLPKVSGTMIARKLLHNWNIVHTVVFVGGGFFTCLYPESQASYLLENISCMYSSCCWIQRPCPCHGTYAFFNLAQIQGNSGHWELLRYKGTS